MVLAKVCTAISLFALVLCIKNENTCRNHLIIHNAIYMYRVDCILEGRQRNVSHEDTRSYCGTLFRLWDWGYKRILPPEKYEIIKPYLQTAKEK